MLLQGCYWLLLLNLLGGFPEGEWEMLSGEKYVGRTTSLSGGQAHLAATTEERDLNIGEVLRFQASVESGKSITPSGVSVSHGQARLIDGSVFGFQSVSHIDGETTVEFQSDRLGAFRIPTNRVVSLRLQKEDRRLAESWRNLLSKESQEDRLIVRKEEVLDFLGGVIGEISPSKIKFLLDNEELEVNAERIYGVIYARNVELPQQGVRVVFRGGDRFVGEGVSLAGDNCRIEMAGGETLQVPSESIVELDYSFGKVQYLSELEPRSVDYTPMFNVTWQYRRDKSLDGNPIRLNRKSFSRGLSIHSKTVLTYRLPAGYRRFRAIMGIDDEITRVGGDVDVVIEGLDRDGVASELLRKDVRLHEPSQPIDLEIDGVSDLRITVDFGEGLDIGDHLDLAEARIVR